jgi:hypothetical protein
MTTQPTEAVGSETNAPDANPFEAIADDMLGQGAEHEEEEELPAEDRRMKSPKSPKTNRNRRGSRRSSSHRSAGIVGC